MKAKKRDKKEAKETVFLLAQVFFFLKRKRVKKGLLAAALVIFVFTVFVASVSATVYDFKDTVDNKAYHGNNTTKPSNDTGVEFSATGICGGSGSNYYNCINASDNARGVREQTYSYPYHCFVFKISESESSITQLQLYWEGYGKYGSCPNLYVWDGMAYTFDNDIIPEFTNSSLEGIDYYRIEKSLTSEGDYYKIKIAEELDEISHLDSLKLITADHPSDVDIYPDIEGNLFTIKNPIQPVSCVDNYGNDCLSLIKGNEGYAEKKYYTGNKGDYLIVDFGDLSQADTIKLVLTSDYTILVQTAIQTKNESGEWKTRIHFVPHGWWATNVFDVTDFFPDSEGEYKLRFYFTDTHSIDYIAIDASEEANVKINWLDPIYAEHNSKGNVLSLVKGSDDNYLITRLGDEIILKYPYQAKENSDYERDFIFVSEGYYIGQTAWLYVWNDTFSSWDYVGMHSETSDAGITKIYTDPTQIGDLINSSGYLRMKVYGDRGNSQRGWIYTDYVKVETYGPVYNLNTGENFFTIQAAINAVNTSDGDTIIVGDGTYMENVVINKSITLKAGSSPIIDGMGGIGITVEANDTVVQDMTVINSSTGIFVFNASFTLQNVTLNNNTIYDCTYPPGNGIEFWDVNNSVINDSYIYNNSLYGVYLLNSSFNNITSNEVYNNSEGIYLFSSCNNTMDKNNVSYNINRGIELGPFIAKANNHNNISNNIINHNGQYGIYFHFFEEYNNVYKNTISNHSYGIFMEHVYNNNLTDNTIFSNNYGIYLNASSNHDIIGNDVYNNTEDGIYLAFFSNYNTIADNNVWNNNNGIALSVILPNNCNDIINNRVISNKKYGIYLKNGERYNNITDNTVSGNVVGICLEDAYHNLVKDNDVVDNKHGIWVNQSSNNTVEWNMIVNNTGGATGMNVTNLSTNNEIHNNCFIDNKPYQAWDDVKDGNNNWNGNYWADYPQWGEYNIHGAAKSKDHNTLRECGGPQRPAAIPTLTLIGIIALIGLLSVIAAMSISIRRKK